MSWIVEVCLILALVFLVVPLLVIIMVKVLWIFAVIFLLSKEGK